MYKKHTNFGKNQHNIYIKDIKDIKEIKDTMLSPTPLCSTSSSSRCGL